MTRQQVLLPNQNCQKNGNTPLSASSPSSAITPTSTPIDLGSEQRTSPSTQGPKDNHDDQATSPAAQPELPKKWKYSFVCLISQLCHYPHLHSYRSRI